MFSKLTSESKKLTNIFSDHSSFLQKHRELYLESQQSSRHSFFSKSRNLDQFLSDFDEDISQKDLSIFTKENINENSSENRQNYEISSDPMEKFNDLNLMEEEEEKSKENDIDDKIYYNQRKKLKHFSRILSVPEYMFSIPSDLNHEDWFIIPRPEGIHCTIIARKGTSFLRDKNGFLLKKFDSEFPGGKPKNKRGSALLDVIYDKEKKICYLLDILYWNEQNLLDCSSEARYFWLESHVSPIKHHENLDIKFINLPKFPCDSQGFTKAYLSNFGYSKDGLLFVAKKGLYLSGVNPYFLLWKDAVCGLYLPKNSMCETIDCCLQITEKGELKTLDGVILQIISKEIMNSMKICKGDLIKVEINEEELSGMRFDDEEKVFLLKGLKIGEKIKGKRTLPDSLSKILFAYYTKNKALTYSELESYLKV